MPFIPYNLQEILLTLLRFTGSQEKNTALALSLIITTPTHSHQPGKVEMQHEIDHIYGHGQYLALG